MARHTQRPKVSQRQFNPAIREHDVFTHPAYGTITLTTPRGGDPILFGSDISHNERVCISIQRAKLERQLNHDWIHQDGRLPLIEIELSHAQFAQFITSSGNGSGTPCTLRHAPTENADIQSVPGIEPLESKAATYKREIKEMVSHRVEEMSALIDRLDAMLTSGKLSKGELREIHRNLMHANNGLPESMSYVVGCAEETIDTMTSHAKIEIESYMSNTALRMGIEHAKAAGTLENKGDQHEG